MFISTGMHIPLMLRANKVMDDGLLLLAFGKLNQHRKVFIYEDTPISVLVLNCILANNTRW